MEDFNLDNAIRRVHNFPIPGIIYYDITSILINPKAFQWCLQKMLDLYKAKKIDKIIALESRGFLFAAPLAEKLGLPLVLIRKAGKLPGKTISAEYSLEYGRSKIEMHIDDINENDSVLIIDDLLASGGTVEASISLLEKRKAHIFSIFAIIGLPSLEYQKKLKDYHIDTLITYST